MTPKKVVKLTESDLIRLIKKVIKESANKGTPIPNKKIDAILVGGLDYRNGDYSISEQVKLFKNGFGQNKNVKGFRFNASTSDVLNVLKNNPNIPVFLFSAGCVKSYDIASSEYVDKNNLHIIEPYAISKKTTRIVQNAVSSGVPAKNVFVGPKKSRGNGIVGGASSSNANSHWGSLTKVASLKANLRMI